MNVPLYVDTVNRGAVDFHENFMKRYHHPDLRSALMRAALAELTEKGPRRFSLRSVAARAGVSHAAPYRHFPDKDSILAALILEGMRALTSTLREANREIASSAREKLGRLGRAYVAYGRENPQVLSLMFSGPGFSALGTASQGTPHGAEYDAFGELESTVRECQREGSLDPERDSGVLSLLIWSTVHGLAILFTENVIPSMAAERGMSETAAEAEILQALGDIFHPCPRRN